MMPHRFYYYNYKAGQGHTYQACRDYFDKQLRILPRILIDVTESPIERPKKNKNNFIPAKKRNIR